MLNFSQIAAQIADAGRLDRERLTRAAAEADHAAVVARGETKAGEDWERQRARIRAARTSWLVAHAPHSNPGTAFPEPPLPPAFAVAATDGSQIAPDRHDSGSDAGCYLLNTGRILLRYGANAARSRLDSVAELLLINDEAEEDDAENAARKAASGLAALRFAREMAELTALAAECVGENLPTVALTDGSLIAWHLYDETGKDAAKQEALTALFTALEATRLLKVPLAGYVSAPGSRDVVNGLRIALCPEEPVQCFRCPHPKNALPCAPVRRATDAALFSRLLAPGERSALFTSQGQSKGFSQILQFYDPAQWVAFFYLHVGAEVARIEVPAWVAEDSALVDRVHAVCLHQARTGRGYPVALSEAHEQAVVRGADREAFLRLLERARVQAAGGTAAGAAAAPSRKAVAKRTRAV